ILRLRKQQRQFGAAQQNELLQKIGAGERAEATDHAKGKTIVDHVGAFGDPRHSSTRALSSSVASSFETHRFAMLLRMRSETLMVRSAATPRVSNHQAHFLSRSYADNLPLRSRRT